MKKNNKIKFLKKICLLLIVSFNLCFSQEPVKIIGFVKWDNTQVSSIPDSNSKYEKFKVQKTDSLEIYNYSYDYPEKSTLFWKIKFKGHSGFISNLNIVQSKTLENFKKIIDKIKENKEKAQDSIRFVELKKLWGAKIALRIIKKEYWLGMTTEMCKKSLGYPDDINRSRGPWGLHQQWIYRKPFKKYLYFENGILTSYQY